MISISTLRTIHAVLACIAWVFLVPFGAVLMRLLRGQKTWAVHGSIQFLALVLYTAAIAIGIYLAKKFHELENYHVVIGLVIFSLAWVQSLAGLLQHALYRKYKRRTIPGHVHRWLGYSLTTLAMINGGLGLLWSGNASRGQCIAYGVVTALIWVGWIVFAVIYTPKPTNGSPQLGKEIDPDSPIIGYDMKRDQAQTLEDRSSTSSVLQPTVQRIEPARHNHRTYVITSHSP